VRLREATRADIPGLAALARECALSQRNWAGDVPVPSLAEEALEWDLRFARAGAWIHLAQEADGGIVGAVAFAAAPGAGGAELMPGVAHVSAVFVDPAHWRRGIARRLLATAQEAMRANGFERAQLWTLAGSPAERFYTAMGWSPDGRRSDYPPMKLEVVAYVKDLGSTSA
jgi:GNAT superfamily N-acetyltransferase